MLGPTFEAVFLGKDVPKRVTPLKQLPRHSAPQIRRPLSLARTVENKDIDSVVRRNFNDDSWLYNVSKDETIGRVLKIKFVGSNKQHITTTNGVFIVSHLLCVIRGKHNKQSIHGDYVTVRSH